MPNKTFLRRPLRHIAVMGWSCWAWIVLLTWRYSTSHLSCIALSQLQHSAQYIYIYIIYTLFSLYITLTLTSPYITSITGPSLGHHHLPMTSTSTGGTATQVRSCMCQRSCALWSHRHRCFWWTRCQNFRPPKPRVFVAVTHSVNNGYGMVSNVLDAQTYTSTLYP